ncbi:MAG TPA: DUF6036 family nucleotidyltransferase [Thermoanaerobaculia bacterium]|jgi:hypothetical protein
MREPLTEERLREFMRLLGRESAAEGRIYLTGGASALLFGWRPSTLDVDLAIVPENNAVLRAIPRLKEQLNVNVELASPSDFIPELPGWQDRSPFITREGKLSFHHYDFYAQCLSKIERAHRKDRADVEMMLAQGLVDRRRLLALFGQIEPELYRYPALDPASFRQAVEAIAGTA